MTPNNMGKDLERSTYPFYALHLISASLLTLLTLHRKIESKLKKVWPLCGSGGKVDGL